MRSRLSRSAVFGLGLLLVAGLAGAADAPILSVDFSLEPAAQAGAYQATVVIADANSGEVLSAPRLVFRAGEPTETSSQVPGGDVVKVEVSVAPDGSSASYAATLMRGDRQIGLQKATIKL